MTIYVDEAFALNLLIDWLLLQISVTLTGQRCSVWRLLLAALLGAVYAVLTLLPSLHWLARPPLRLLLFCLMAMTAFGFGRQALKPGLWYLGVCCGFCGLSYACSVLTGRGVLLLGGTVWYAVRFRFLVLLAGMSYALVRLLLPRLGQHKGKQICALTLILDERRVRLTALLDTGNTLRDPVSGLQVLVAEASVLRRLLPQLPLDPGQLGDPIRAMELIRLLSPKSRPRLVPYRTVGVESALLLAIPCLCAEEGRKQPWPILAAFSPTPVSDGGLYEAVFSPG